MKQGQIYCITNDLYKNNGQNIYKLGKTINLKNRLKNYVTGFLNPMKVLYVKNVIDINSAEKLLFDKLSKYRLKSNRELFQVEIQLIKLTMDEVGDVINNRHTKPDWSCLSFIKDDMLKTLLKTSFAGFNYDIAKLIVYLPLQKYSVYNKELYVFKDYTWQKIQREYLRQYISTQVVKYYDEIQTDNYIITKRIFDIINKLKKRKSAYQIIDDIFDILSLQENKCDTNMIKFNNGVLNTKTHEFREGKSEAKDKMYLTTNTIYNSDYIDEINVYLRQLLPWKEMRDYTLKILSQSLENNIIHEDIYMFIGSNECGINGLMNLMQFTFGDYAQQRNIDDKTKKGCRFCHLKIKKNINVYDLQEITKYKVNDITQPLYIFNINELKIENTRIKKIEFTSKMCDEIPYDKWKSGFMSILLKYNKLYKKEGLDVPKIQNIYKAFLNDMTIPTLKSGVHFRVLYQVFVKWHHDTFPTKKIVSSRIFIKSITEMKTTKIGYIKIKKSSSNGLRHIKLK